MYFLENIKKQNQFPILFIGSGITQRYFKNSPSWLKLLEQIWNKVYENSEDKHFYDYCNALRLQGEDDFGICMLLADELEKEVDTSFSQGKLQIGGLTNEKSFKEKISPFRCLIANIFSDLEKREGVDEEIKAFAGMLQKARFIITTNYDTFIEDCYQKLSVKVGNAGLFEKSASYGELYKIHGSIKSSNSITISRSDYEKNESKLALVNAKILSHLIDSPVLFLGYSLTDENIRNLLETYSKNMPFGAEEAAKRIGVVNWVQGKEDITDYLVFSDDRTVAYTDIQTDNYKQIYEQITEINQGYLPSEIAKYEGAFRRIIEVKGSQSGLDTILTSFEDLTKLTDEQISQKNIVVAFGESRYIYKMPSYADYIRDYFASESEMPAELVLKFLASQPLATPIPCYKHLLSINQVQGMEAEKTKLTMRQEEVQKFKEKVENLMISQKDIPLLETQTTPLAVYEQLDVKEHNRLRYLTRNIGKFKTGEVQLLIKKLLNENSDKVLSKTEYRRLFMAYSNLQKE